MDRSILDQQAGRSIISWCGFLDRNSRRVPLGTLRRERDVESYLVLGRDIVSAWFGRCNSRFPPSKTRRRHGRWSSVQRLQRPDLRRLSFIEVGRSRLSRLRLSYWKNDALLFGCSFGAKSRQTYHCKCDEGPFCFYSTCCERLGSACRAVGKRTPCFVC